MVEALKTSLGGGRIRRVYTDNETWAGDIHPAQALRQLPGADGHRGEVDRCRDERRTDSPSRIRTMPAMLDVVGFDTATPQVISDFIG